MDLQAVREHAQMLLESVETEGHGAILLGLVGNAERAHFEEVTALRLALDEFVEDTPCQFDHHGGCQAHGVTKPCRNATAKALLTGPLNSEWMRLWDAASAAFLAYEHSELYRDWSESHDSVHDTMAALGQALAEHKAKWAPA